MFLLSVGQDRKITPQHIPCRRDTASSAPDKAARAGLMRCDWLENTSAVTGLYTEFLQTFVSPARSLEERLHCANSD